MQEINQLEIGTTLNNDQLCDIFKCSPQGGMRRSKKTNSLVIVSNHVESIYDDRWLKNILHYTGMGQKGDQRLDYAQNKTLAESDRNGVAVYLFEVYTPGAYRFCGQVILADNPYQETQSDAAGQTRKVWIFPLSLKEGVTLAIPQNVVAELETRQTRVAQRLTDEEIQKRASVSQRSAVGTRRVETAQYQRNVWVAEHAKRRANGTCQLCTKPAPFMDSKGKPYLETHHIEWLSTGGADTISNTVALCPNCHRKMHVINDEADRKSLIARVFEQTPKH